MPRKNATKTARKTSRAPKKKADAGRNANVVYAYGFVRPGFDVARAPAGLEETPVLLATGRGHAALVSRLPSALYSPDQVEQHSGDVSWLTPRAMAHDRVLTWAQEHGGVVPLPMFSLWGSNAALEKTLAKRAAELKRIFGRVDSADEFGVRVYRRDADVAKNLGDIDPEIARLQREADAASPGQRYLLERKIAERGKQSVKAAGYAMAQEVFETLRPIAREALARPLVPESGRAPDATLVLNGAFLVARHRLDEFRAAVGELVRHFQPRGLTFDFTGPWPPYNFVADEGGGRRRSKKGKA